MNLLNVVIGCSLAFASAGGVAMELVKDGKSEFIIYHEADAPSSIVHAAKDLQDYCRKVTGWTLPIVDNVAANMISLGVNSASRVAGLTAEGIPLEGFAKTVKDGSVYVLGEDTPDGERCAGGGVSNGTSNGVYTLLEECFGVRWRFPTVDETI